MTNMREWIRKNRKEIDEYISKQIKSDFFPHNDRERELWTLNDQFLYSMYMNDFNLN